MESLAELEDRLLTLARKFGLTLDDDDVRRVAATMAEARASAFAAAHELDRESPTVRPSLDDPRTPFA